MLTGCYKKIDIVFVDVDLMELGHDDESLHSWNLKEAFLSNKT